ncbi:outer membrane beta-barrel protein [Dechloromonas sp. XY25]|uniref:Outer membrane beta-barrel protein n=1 Tax=Dechloromonas hankyongensis TaxID=2908002 RepID=A0ABS9K0A3_9RHOO|nr:OmpW family outer membrane protein [Dechloromonas hankyongensis]MCG2576546.1 outer membrane beta-barrel protein [Dechloromonas hankyongensis]
MSKKILVAALVATGVLSAPVVKADEGSFMVRARAVYIDFKNGQKDGLDRTVGAKVEADNLWIPEIDLSYFFTKNLAAELVLTYPQEVDIKIAGVKQGTIKALPPSLLLQYHFTELGAFKPYVGAGVNYTFFYNTNNILGGVASVERSSWGLAGQVGFDYMFTKNIGLNVDVKYIKMDTDVYAGGSKLGNLNLSPVTAGVGVTYRF